MKNSWIFLALLSFVFIIQSCDIVEPPFIESTDNPVVPGQKKRKILVEDYTGHNCPNCPGAGIIAEDIKSSYGEQVVVLTVHAGFFANPFCSLGGGYPSIDFKTTVGTELDNFFGISTIGNPNGMVNRIQIGGSNVINPSSWTSIVDTMVSKDPEAYIDITNTYNSSTRSLNTTLSTKFLSLLTGTYKLCVFIKEDSIQSWQQNSDSNIGTTPIIDPYMHRNVLRASLNNTWGDTLSGSVIVGDSISKNYTYTLPLTWNDAHCWVVAFVYHAETNLIIQAEEKRVK